jgi:hypothetical protein
MKKYVKKTNTPIWVMLGYVFTNCMIVALVSLMLTAPLHSLLEETAFNIVMNYIMIIHVVLTLIISLYFQIKERNVWYEEV